MLFYRQFIFSLILLCVTGLSSAYAFNLKVKPGLLAKSTYTSNEDRTPSPTSADIITEITPGVTITAKSSRINGKLDYAARKQVSYTRNIEKLNHTFDGSGKLALIKNYVTVFSAASYTQRQNRIGQNILFDETILLTDIADIGSLSSGIEVTNRIKRHFNSSINYTFNTRRSNSTRFADTTSNTVIASIRNGSSLRRLSWGGNARYQELDDAYLKIRKIAEITGSLGYAFNRRSGFRTSFGYESNPQYTYVNPNTSSRGVIATGSVFYRSPKKFGFELMAGKRAYGNTYQATTDWQSKMTNLSASYGKTVLGNNASIALQQKVRQATLRLQYNKTLTEYNFANALPNPAFTTAINNANALGQIPSTLPTPLLISVQTGTYIISRLSSGVTLQGIKNSIELSADYETKIYTLNGRNSRTYKAKAQWKNQISTLASANITLEGIDANDISIRAEGLYSSAKVSYEHQIKRSFILAASIQRWERKTDDNQSILINLANISLKGSF